MGNPVTFAPGLRIKEETKGNLTYLITNSPLTLRGERGPSTIRIDGPVRPGRKNFRQYRISVFPPEHRVVEGEPSSRNISAEYDEGQVRPRILLTYNGKGREDRTKRYTLVIQN